MGGGGGESETVRFLSFFSYFFFFFLHRSLSAPCTATAQRQWGEFLSAGEFSYANRGLVTVCGDARTFPTLGLFPLFFPFFIVVVAASPAAAAAAAHDSFS